MRLVCLADTHNQHSNIQLPEGDILIHAGDFTEGGSKREAKDFLNWVEKQPHEHKILVPGNHDFYFEKQENFGDLSENIHILIDQGVKLGNFAFWGSPFIPGMGNWAFSRERGADIRKHWDLVPEATDILITHTPAYNILDQTGTGLKLGCEELGRQLDRLNLSHHLFGHIHHSAGKIRSGNTLHYNLSILDERFRLMNAPYIIDL